MCSGVDSDMIQLVGRWTSNTMFQYLAVTAQPIMQHIASAMHLHGKFSNNPAQYNTLQSRLMPVAPTTDFL